MSTSRPLLHLHRTGPVDGTPLLAIHGITAHGRRFDRLCAEYLFDRHVVAPDLRGHGASLPDAPWNLDTHVDDIVAVLDHLQWDSTDVIGHSLGGNLAIRLLAAHPKRVRRVVLLDPALMIPAETATENATYAMSDQSFRTLDSLVEARRLGRSDTAIPFSDEDARIASYKGEDKRWRMNYERAAVVAMWSELARPLPPLVQARSALLIVATQAQLVQAPQVTYLEENFEELLTQVELDLGHMLYWDDLETVGRIVAGWLND
jgi:lipase